MVPTKPAMDLGFICVYWLSLLAIFLIVEYAIGRRHEKNLEDSSQVDTGRQSVESSTWATDDHDLPETVWSLALLASIKQAKYPSGDTVGLGFVCSITMVMASLQLFTLFLIVHTLNPEAHPITVHPSTPWNKEAWTVNSMKWIMAIFLSVFLSGDAQQCQTILRETLRTRKDRFAGVGPGVPLLIAGIQLCVNILTVFAGVSAVLSFRAVPDIIYSSLAITFVAHVDDMTWSFCQTNLALEVDFKIKHGLFQENVIHAWLEVLLRFLAWMPAVMALFIMGHAWRTNEMPTAWMTWLLH